MRQVISIWELYDQGSHHDYNESPTLLKRSTFEINEIVLAYSLFGGGVAILKNRSHIKGHLQSIRKEPVGKKIQLALKALEMVTENDKIAPNDTIKTQLENLNNFELESLRNAHILLSSLSDSKCDDTISCQQNALGTNLTIEANIKLSDSDGKG